MPRHRSLSSIGQSLVVALGKPDAAATFGIMADTYMKTVLKAGSEYHRIDVVFDRYRDETIKGTTRMPRSTDNQKACRRS